jgi:hypothetical protein
VSKIKIVHTIPCEEGGAVPEQVTPSNLQQFYYYGEMMKIFNPQCGVLRLSTILDDGGYGYGPVVGSEDQQSVMTALLLSLEEFVVCKRSAFGSLSILI